MKKHSGMRPHDIVVLLKIAAKNEKPWMMKDLSVELGISASEVSESLNRSAIAGLIAQDKKRVMSIRKNREQRCVELLPHTQQRRSTKKLLVKNCMCGPTQKAMFVANRLNPCTQKYPKLV
jgi:predicted transcriptional regulator